MEIGISQSTAKNHLSASAAIVGLVVPTLHGARLLLGDLEKITNAPEAVARLKGEADSLSANLDLLRDIEEPVWVSLGLNVADESRASIESCGAACDTIRADILRWTKRSPGGKLSWLHRINIGFFRDHQLQAHLDRLRTHRLSLQSIVGTATLYASIHNSQMTDDVRDLIRSQRSQLVAASNTTSTEVARVQRSLIEIQTRSLTGFATDSEAVTEDHRETTVMNLEDLLEALKQSQTLLRELSSRSEPTEAEKSAKTGDTTNITFGNNEKACRLASAIVQ